MNAQADRQLDGKALRRCLGYFATGVTVVSFSDDDGEPRGATMNAFTSVSLDPPLVLISVARSAKSCAKLEGRPFTVNVLASDQLPVAMQFAGQPGGKLGLRWARGGAAPHLSNALAWMECEPWRVYDGGDHVLYLGEVQRLECRKGEPLLFFRGSFMGPGLELFHSPRTLLLDGRPVPDWLRLARTIHDHTPLA
jgi:flavin reductase (DIM6/NTAB) family NADH-FMN oxidoreductase RutF